MELQKEIIKQNTPFAEVPAPSADNKQILSHLTNVKKINANLIKEEIEKGNIYQTETDKLDGTRKNINIVFIKKDDNDIPIYAIRVGENNNIEKADFKTEHKNYSQARSYISKEGNCNTLLVFNNPVSMMTQKSIEMDLGNEKRSHCICCISDIDKAVEHYLSSHENITDVKVCMDKSIAINNQTGQQFDLREYTFNKISNKVSSKHLKVTKKFPQGKSLNQDYVKCKQKVADKNQQKTMNRSNEKNENSLEFNEN
ncbi:MAG: hypothetical protein RSE93_06755 [Oscillospiraceae bacterium]